MGPIRRRSKTVHYDPELFENWTLARLKDELNSRGINFPNNARRMALVRLLRLNENSTQSLDHPTRGELSILGGARSRDPSVIRHEENAILSAGESHDSPQINNNNDNSSNRVLVGLVSKLSSTVQDLQQNVVSLTNKVNTLIAERSEFPVQARAVAEPSVNTVQTVASVNRSFDPNPAAGATQFNLETAYSALRRSVPSAAAGSEEQLALGNLTSPGRTTRGYAVESLPFVETVSPQLKRNIQAGMDINLASLLIPYYSGAGVMENNLGVDKSQNVKSDPRINRTLTLGEFIQAFGTYKNIMCSAHPHRRSELDLYERDVVDMATRYPGKGFYEYHKRFSADAAAHVRYNNIPVDWSIRNNSLFCNIFANAKPNTCNFCGSTFHTSGFCNQSPSYVRNQYGQSRSSDQDIYGRERVFLSRARSVQQL